MFIKILDRVDLQIKPGNVSILDHQNHGLDLIADTSYTLLTPDNGNYKINDILQIREDGKDYFYVVDKKVEANKINFKSVFNLFDDNLYLPDTNITLKALFDTYYVNNLSDSLQDIAWLDTSEIDDTYLISLNTVNGTTGTDNGVYNMKSVIVNTILSRRLTFDVTIDDISNTLKFIIQPNNTINEINLNPLIIYDIKLPQVNTNITAVDLVLQVSHNVEVEDTLGTVQVIEEPLRTEYERWVLTEDNQVTQDLLTSNRVNPIKVDTIINSWNEDGTTTKPVNEDLARTKLVDKSSYYWSFELVNSREMYLFDIKLGEQLKVWYLGVEYITVCTGIEYKQNTTLYKLGFNRTDLMFRIKNNK